MPTCSCREQKPGRTRVRLRQSRRKTDCPPEVRQVAPVCAVVAGDCG
jgi:hypothetical protein